MTSQERLLLQELKTHKKILESTVNNLKTITPSRASKMRTLIEKNPYIGKWYSGLHRSDQRWYAKRVNSGEWGVQELVKASARGATRISGDAFQTLNKVLRSKGLSPMSKEAKIQQHIAKDIADQLGETITNINKPLGGAQGLAYTTTRNRIIKITSNPTEAMAAYRAASRKTTKHLVLSDIRALRINDQTSPFYVLSMDQVTTLTQKQYELWGHMYQAFFDKNLTNAVLKKEYQKGIEQGWELYTSSESRNFFKNILSQRSSIIKDFERHGIHKWEAHPGNVGFDINGKFKHFDFWMKDQPNPGVGEYLWQAEKLAYRKNPINVDVNLNWGSY